MEMTTTEAAEIRHWPSLPDPREIKWDWVAGQEGERRLEVSLATNRHVLAAGDLNWLIQFAAQRRFEMRADQALSPYECPTENWFMADAFTFEPLPETRSARVWSRLPGIGWVRLHLDGDELRNMAETLLAVAGPRVAPTQAH